MKRPTSTSSPTQGLRSEALRAALDEALRGRSDNLERLLANHSGMPSPHPNLKLAAAFGVEVANLDKRVVGVLERLTTHDAAPDTAEVFLPIVAAHAWAARLLAKTDQGDGWPNLCELAADERRPVRIGALDALVALGSRPGFADALVQKSVAWLEEDDEQRALAANALSVEALRAPAVLATLTDQDALLALLSNVLQRIGQLSRAAERWEGRRRLLLALPKTVAAAIIATRGEPGMVWFEAEAKTASHPDVRHVLSVTLDELRRSARALNEANIERLRNALAASAAPIRDAARVRPGTGRGRRSRRVR